MVNFEHISHIVLMFLLLTLNMQLPVWYIFRFVVKVSDDQLIKKFIKKSS